LYAPAIFSGKNHNTATKKWNFIYNNAD